MSASVLIGFGELWLYAGGAVALVFLLYGIDRVDEDARGAYVFRPLLVPGILLIWPLVLWRWWVLETGRDAWRNRHRIDARAQSRIWLALGLVIPAMILGGMWIKQSWSELPAPRRLEASR